MNPKHGFSCHVYPYFGLDMDPAQNYVRLIPHHQSRIQEEEEEEEAEAEEEAAS